MKASETKFQPIIEGTKQYVVPLFQRPYSWGRKQWDVLWEDLADLCENTESGNHFIGSIVTMPTMSVPEGVSKYLLIDGQQRLTTIFIVLALLRDFAKRNGSEELADEVHQTMLVNPFKKSGDFFKLMPTQVDRASFQRLINQEDDDGQPSPIFECYRYFEHKVTQDKPDIDVLSKVITNRLSVVSIVLDADDNPHLVFESLNAKGRPLTQADLIRNYFFMRIHVDEQDGIHAKYWQPMQSALGDNLTECIRHYLMRNGAIVRQGDVYFTLKERVKDSDAVASLTDIAAYAEHYRKLLAPESEPYPQIRSALLRLNRLEVTTAYPFLLNCYHDYGHGRLVGDSFLRVLQILENYVIRRFVCNVPSSQLNKIFPLLYGQAQLKNPSDFVDGVRSVLQTRGYPKDAEFRTRLVESKLYGSGERAVKTKLILETLEASYHHKEQVPSDELTIEHVMPQTLTDWWRGHLGGDWQADHELYLDVLGNLTLTAYNSELSNDPFPDKQRGFAKSHLELNRYFEKVPVWNRAEIERRSKALADIALGVWPYFGEDQTITATIDTATGKTPRAVTIMGQRMPVASWREVHTCTFGAIADLEPEAFASLAKEYPRFIGQDPGRFRRSYKLNNGYFVEVNLSSRDIYRLCTQAIESIGLSADDWVVETG